MRKREAVIEKGAAKQGEGEKDEGLKTGQKSKRKREWKERERIKNSNIYFSNLL